LTLVGQGRYDRHVKARNHEEIQTGIESDGLTALNGFTRLEHLGLTLGTSSTDAYSSDQ
jgi:hypothetical protein